MTRRTHAFTLVELLVVIAIISLLVLLLLPAISAAREAARRTQCINRLKQLQAGLINYESAHQYFPPGADKSGAAWPAFILPYLEENALFDALTLDDPAESAVDSLGNRDWLPGSFASLESKNPAARNVAALAKPVSVFTCPSSASYGINSGNNVENDGVSQQFRVNYAASGSHNLLRDDDPRIFSEPNTVLTGAFVYDKPMNYPKFKDGLSKTIFLGEVDYFDEPSIRTGCGIREFDNQCDRCGAMCIGAVKDHVYLGSDDLDRMQDLSELICSTAIMPNSINEPLGVCGSQCQTIFPNLRIEMMFRSPHAGLCVFSFGDGSVRAISDSIDRKIFQALGSRRGEETNHYLK